MRIGVVCLAGLCLAAVPAFAQSPRDVTGPWTLTPSLVLCTDLPVAAKPTPRVVVKAPFTVDSRLAAALGNQLLIKRTPDDGLAPGQRYISARLHNGGKDFPRPGEGHGQLRITGVVTVSAVDDVNAIANVDLACDSIEAGDLLEPYVEIVLPNEASPNAAPDFSERAQVLFGMDNRALVGVGDVVSIDRGTLHGVRTGERYAIYRDRRDGTPLIYLGEAVVMATGEQTSKVIVTKSLEGLEMGDVAVPRRQP